MLTSEALKALIASTAASDREQAVDGLVQLLTSPRSEERKRGCELFQEGLGEALFRSCLNYSALVGGVQHPLVDVLKRTVERWAAMRGGDHS